MNIYQIKNQEGKFLNIDSNKPYYTSISWRASYLRSEKLAKEVIRLSGVSGLEVFETTESAYTEELAHSTTSIAIQMDSLQLKLSNVAYHLPTMSGVNKSLKNFLVNTSVKLKSVNPQFNEFLTKKEDATNDVSAVYDEFIEKISTVDIWEMENISKIIDSYRKNPKSIMGMAEKINKF